MWTNQRCVIGLRPIWLFGLLLLGNGLSSVSMALEINVASPASGIWTASQDVGFNVGVTDSSAAYAFIDWQGSLVGWWKWENDPIDSSASGNIGELKGLASYTSGRFGQGVLTPDGDSYIDLGNRDAFAFSKRYSFTFAVWTYLPENTGSTVVTKGRYNVCLRYRMTTTPRWQLDLGAGSPVEMQGMHSIDPATARWTHAAVVWDASTSTAYLYIDGQHRGQMIVDIDGDFDTASHLELARYGGSGVIVDDFVVFNRALTNTEIFALYNATAAPLQTTFPDLAEMTPYSYTVHAANAAGEYTSQSGQVTVDTPNSAPTGTITNPISLTRSSSSSQTFTATVQDTNGDTTLATATLYWDYGQPFGPTAYTDSLSGNADTVSTPVSGLSLGTITWNLYVEDSEGHGGFITPNQTLIIGQTDYHVATYGSDSADGTIDHPFATIQHFADNCYPGDTCYIRGGTYRETITPVRGGNSSAPITFRAYPGEMVTISGTEPVSGGWQVHSGNIYKTTAMSWDLGRGNNQVFVDGEVMLEARWPNMSEEMQYVANQTEMTRTVRATGSGTGCSYTTTTLTLQDGALGAFPDDYWIGGTVHATWDRRYHALTALITDSASFGTYGTLDATLDAQNAGRDNANNFSLYYIVGCYNALDQAKEWYYDSATGTLYLWIPDGGSPTNRTVEAKARQAAFDLDGCAYINLIDLGIFAGNITSDGDSSRIVINGLDARYVSHYMVLDYGDMADGQKGTRDSGIILGGDYCEMRDSTIYHSAGSGVAILGDSCTVSGCTITYCNYMETQAAPVCCGLEKTQNNVVTHNILRYAGRDFIEHTNAQKVTITYNDMAYNRWTGALTDLGATYAIGTDGKGSVIAYNKIHDIRSMGIYLDNENYNFDIHHNVVWGVDTNWTSTLRGIHMNTPSEGHAIYHNTCVGIPIGAKAIAGYEFSTQGSTVKNNICSYFDEEGFSSGGGDAAYNLIGADPLYVDEEANDYRLQAGSPAVNTGIDVGFTQDMIGSPIVGAPDIGAYEYASTPANCTITASVMPVEGGTISPSGTVIVDPGSNPTFMMTAQAGYRIADVLVDGASTGAPLRYTFHNVVGNHTIQASFTPRDYVAYVTASNGSVTKTPQKTTYSLGEAITVQAVPNTGYHFDSWTGDLSGTSNPATLTMDSDKVITANLAINTYTLSTTATTGSVVRTPENALYNHGEVVTLQAVPGVGRWFANWSGDLNGTGNPATLLMDSNKSVTANFTEIPPDSQPPVVTGCMPEANAIQTPLNALVTLHVSDDGWGVDANTVTVSVDGAVVYTGNVPSYSSALGVCRRIGTQADYKYAYQSNEDFDFDQRIVVMVDAADLKGNVMPQHSYFFTTTMRAFGPNLGASSTLGSLGKGSPATARDSSGNVWTVWHAGAPGERDIYVSMLHAGARNFTGPTQLTTSTSDQSDPDIAIGTDDTLYVVWQDRRRGNWDIYTRSSLDGVTWSADARITDSNDNQVSPAIVVDTQVPTGVHVAWQDDGAGNQDICVSSSSDGFTTKTAHRVTSNASDQSDPQIAVDAFHTVYLVWTDRRNDSDDIYGASSSAGPWTNVAVVTGPGNQNSAAIAAEAAGSVVHLLWVDDTSGNQDVCYASSNALPTTPLVGMSINDDMLDADQAAPSIVVAGSEGTGLRVFACWQDSRNVAVSGGDTDVYFMEIREGTETNILIGDDRANSNQSEPAIGVQIDGHPYVVWTDDRNMNMDIYWAGSTFMEQDAVASRLVTASTGATVGVAPPSSLGDVSVVIPPNACPHDATVTIRRVYNLQSDSAPCISSYDFGPSGLDFDVPVTITIPYSVEEYDSGPLLPYWHDSRMNMPSQNGITDVEVVEISSTVRAVRFKTTHFTTYVLLPASTGDSGGGGGGGGGCSLSPYGESDPYGYFVPYVILATMMGMLRLRGSARYSASRGYARRGRT